MAATRVAKRIASIGSIMSPSNREVNGGLMVLKSEFMGEEMVVDLFHGEGFNSSCNRRHKRIIVWA